MRGNSSCNHSLQTRSLSFLNRKSVICVRGSLLSRSREDDNEPSVFLVRRESTSAHQPSATAPKSRADDREFDIVLFGATGFVGRYCIEQLHHNQDNIKWAVAGRNRTKVSEILNLVSTWVDKDLSQTPVIEADIDKPESLVEMAKKTRCIINTVGPYTPHGDKMITTCLAEGTHMVDPCGELHFNEFMRNEYHNEAKDKGVIFLPTSGFGSVPSELLLQYAKANFPGQLNTFETFLTFKEGEHGSVGNMGTLKSLISIARYIANMGAIRKDAWGSVFKQPWQKVEFRKSLWLGLSLRRGVPGITLPLVATDKPALNHSEFFRREIDPKYQRVQIQNRFYDYSRMQIMKVGLVPSLLGTLSQFPSGRKLLLKYPYILSLGLFKKGGPSREQVLTCGFTMIGIGKGWHGDEPRNEKPRHQIIVRVDGPECGYRTTSICLVESAICLVREGDRVPMKGGYLTPGFALEKTSLLERICKKGLEFKIVE